MNLPRIIAILAAACGMACGFPASTSRTAFRETFTGGTDSFDLNLHCLTLVPYDSGSNQSHFKYPSYFTVRPIRSLPVDMADAIELTPVNGIYPVVPVAGLPVIHGITPIGFQMKRAGEVVLTNAAGTSSVTLRVLSSSAFEISGELLVLSATYRTLPGGGLAIQFDYSLDPDYLVDDFNSAAKGLVRNTFQAEILPSGVIRYSYLGVDATVGEVGLFSTFSSSFGGTEQNYLSALISAPDKVVAESAGNALALLSFPGAAANTTFTHATVAGSAVAPTDFTALAGGTPVSSGATSATISVPIINDTLRETSESFDVSVHMPGNPDWIVATPRVWILDDDLPGSFSSPLIHREGNRVFIVPPDPTAVTITGFRLLSVAGGNLTDPLTQTSLVPGSTFSVAAGAVGLIASGTGIHFTVEAIQSGGASASIATAFDLDGANPSPVFGFTSDRVEVTEGDSAGLIVQGHALGASVSYRITPASAQPMANGIGDYAPNVRALEFKNGIARIEIPILADGIAEGPEEFVVRLVDASSGAFIGPAARAKVVIADGSGPLVSPWAQRLPEMVPSGRAINRNLTTVPWRFAGEPLWRPAGSHAWNTREGLHQALYRVDSIAKKLYMAPASYLYQGGTQNITDLDVAFGDFSAAAVPTPGTGTGSLQVNISPSAIGCQWRRMGEGTWRDSGFIEGITLPSSPVPAGDYLVEFNDTISGYDAPSPRVIRVTGGQTTVASASYQPRPASGVSPAVVGEPDLKVSGTSWTHIPFSAQTGDFKLTFEFKPGAGSNNTLGVSSGMATAETALSAAVKAIPGSNFTAWNGSAYASSSSLAATADQWHFAEIEVKPSASTYKLHITPPTGAKVTVQSSGVFRAAATELQYLSMQSSSGSASMRGLRVTETPATSTWKIIPFPDQTGSFEIAVALDIRPPFLGIPSSLPFSFHVTDGRNAAPSGAIGPVAFQLPAFQGSTGRYEPLVVRMHVNLALPSPTYELRDENNQPLDIPNSAGNLPQALTKANHFYISENSEDIVSFTVADTLLPPASAVPTGTGTNLPSHWTHIPITPQTGRFSLTCDLRVLGQTVGSGDLVDSLVGLSSSKVTLWNQISVALRAKLPSAGSGYFDAHTGGPSGAFAREGDVAVVDGKRYHAVFHVDVPAQTYRVEVSPEDGGPVVILQQGTFRQSTTELRYLTLRSVQGRIELSNVRGPLAHPEDSPPYLTGQIETSRGFGTGTVVADHVVLTSARLVFDLVTRTFIPGITWRRSGGGSAEIPDACEPSHIVLATDHAAAAMGAAGDALDVALLVFRPLDVPLYDNAPGGGGYSGFEVDDGTAAWTSPATVKQLPSFPVSGVTAGNPGRIHGTVMGSASFSADGNGLYSASGIQTPPGSEGAAVFVRGNDKRYRPAAVCVGTVGGVPKFRAIDSSLADAIYQANSYQRQPGFLQGLLKGGVYYIAPTLSVSSTPNRAHILSNAIPPSVKWSLKRYTTVTSNGGQALSVEPGSYTVTFPSAPSGYTGPSVSTLTKTLTAGTTWNLPAVYVAAPPSSYDTWVAAHYDEFEANSAVSSPGALTPWLGVDNLTAYAFGFNPNGGLTPFATATTPGYPLVSVNPPTVTVELHRRTDPKLSYQIQSSDGIANWQTITTDPTVLSTSGDWQRVRWTLTGQPGRWFVRTRVTLTP
jgi:Calx-beta domain